MENYLLHIQLQQTHVILKSNQGPSLIVIRTQKVSQKNKRSKNLAFIIPEP